MPVGAIGGVRPMMLACVLFMPMLTTTMCTVLQASAALATEASMAPLVLPLSKQVLPMLTSTPPSLPRLPPPKLLPLPPLKPLPLPLQKPLRCKP